MAAVFFSRRYLVPALLVASLWPAAGTVFAAEVFPVRPLRMLVGYPAGGPNDITARIVAEQLSTALGQQVIVDNRAGAGGTISATILAQAAPDGYTLGLCANGEMAIAPNLRIRMPYDPLRDFAPVSRVGAGHLALVVPTAFAVKTTADFVAMARTKPGSLNFASAGTGSTSHLAGELFKSMAKIDILHVPYKGAAPALADIIGAQVQMLVTGYSGVLPHAKAGRLRVLGVTGAQRLKAAPEIPSIGETLPGYEVNSWYGVFAPAATPRVLLDRFEKEITGMTRTTPVIARMLALGIEPEGNTRLEFAAQMKREIAKWRRVLESAGVAKE